MNFFNAGALIYQGEKIAFGDSQLLKLLEPERVKEVFEILKNEIKDRIWYKNPSKNPLS
jgi:hypothetical protein